MGKGHTNQVYAIDFSPDGTRLASGSLDKTVALWDAKTGQELISLKDRTSGVSTLTFSPSERFLAVPSFNDGTTKLYNATPLPEKPAAKGD